MSKNTYLHSLVYYLHLNTDINHMEQDIITGILGALLLTIGISKMKFIKSYVKQILGEKNSFAFTLLLLIIVAVSPFLISLYFPTHEKETATTVTLEKASNNLKTDTEDTIAIINGSVEKNKEIKGENSLPGMYIEF